MKPLLLAGVAAAAYYAYRRMSEEQRRNLVDSIKKQGKELMDRFKTAKSNPRTQENSFNS